jgi:hypothetical protein
LLQLALLALLGAALPSSAHAQRAPDRLANADEAAALAWLKKSAQTLTSEQPAAAELKPLLARLGGARIVGVGEATHGTHEDFAFKAALIKALASAGRINAVAFITGYQSGRRLDAFVAGGPGTAVEALRESGLPPAWMTGEVADLLDWLRGWNAAGKDRIRVVGVDVQDALRDTHAALELLAAVEPEAAGPLQARWKDARSGRSCSSLHRSSTTFSRARQPDCASRPATRMPVTRRARRDSACWPTRSPAPASRRPIPNSRATSPSASNCSRSSGRQPGPCCGPTTPRSRGASPTAPIRPATCCSIVSEPAIERWASPGGAVPSTRCRATPPATSIGRLASRRTP